MNYEGYGDPSRGGGDSWRSGVPVGNHSNTVDMIFFTIATAKQVIFGTDILWKSFSEFDFE